MTLAIIGRPWNYVVDPSQAKLSHSQCCETIQLSRSLHPCNARGTLLGCPFPFTLPTYNDIGFSSVFTITTSFNESASNEKIERNEVERKLLIISA